MISAIDSIVFVGAANRLAGARARTMAIVFVKIIVGDMRLLNSVELGR